MRLLTFSVFICAFIFPCFQAKAQTGWQLGRSLLTTPWTDQVSPENAWPEYPRPTMVREEWMNLNGEWGFQLMEDKTERIVSSGKILVPFPVESALSGIGKKVKPGQVMVYNRSFTVPETWKGKRVLLHFGAVDYHASVFLNNKKVGEHRGGYDSFTVDLTDFLRQGNNAQQLSLQITDPTNTGGQPVGKQHLDAGGIWYTPISGIWQTVWLEPVPRTYIKSIRAEPDVDKTRVLVRVELAGDNPKRTQVLARIWEDGQKLSESKGISATPHLLRIRKDAKLWTLESPHLYDLEITTLGEDPDVVSGYFGLRKISVEKDENGVPRIHLNNQPVFLNGVLDQGYWPDGLYTAPNEAAMREDIENMKSMGFNMLRKHVKVEPARWYHLCDQMGMLVWQDMPNGKNETKDDQRQFLFEIKAMVDALFNHPSIITWVAFNEGWGQHDTDSYVEKMKEWDPTRLVIGASGWTDTGSGDIHDIHAYPGPEAPPTELARAGVLGEYGGFGLNVRGHQWNKNGWGYQLIETPNELLKQYEDLRRRLIPLIENEGLSAAVYTQLSDIESENNGLLTYDRKVTKMDPALVALSNEGYLPPKPYRSPRIFPKKRYVSLSTPRSEAEIWFTMDPLGPEARWKKYTEPILLKKTSHMNVKAQWPGGKESRTREYVFTKTKAIKSKAPKSWTGGAKVKVFKGSWEKLPEFNQLKENMNLTVPEISLDSIQMEKHFGLVFEGWIEIPQTAAFTFGIASDDGSRLFVAGQKIIENDGLHGIHERTGTIALKKGLHPIRLEYFQKEGGKGLEVWMEGLDGEKRSLSF